MLGLLHIYQTENNLSRSQILVQSDFQSLICGVPQGSVLGPLLFLIYINDFENCSTLCDFRLFADDSNLFLFNRNIRVLEDNANSALIEVSEWLNTNKLSLNVEKSNTSSFIHHSKKYIQLI